MHPLFTTTITTVLTANVLHMVMSAASSKEGVRKGDTGTSSVGMG